ncbi:taste receptor type 2 member 13-like, partial [Alligator mississippiensis]|uniref:taste receptor type 2 member 13-like n=1 Tax=Alligator mississippiensis TaxID=8496 RepID=UPI00287758EA
CVKIADFSQPFFIHLNLRITRQIPCIGFCMAFTIFIISALLLLFSLWRHTWKMQHSFRNPSVQAHIQAVKSIMSFFIINLPSCMKLETVMSRISKEKGLKQENVNVKNSNPMSHL